MWPGRGEEGEVGEKVSGEMIEEEHSKNFGFFSE